MLEWKPKLITLVLALALVAMLVSLIRPAAFGGAGLGNYNWEN